MQHIILVCCAIAGGIVALGTILLVCYKAAKYLVRSNDALDLVRKELAPNGGGSIKDKVDKLEQRVEAVEFGQRVMASHAGLDLDEAAAKLQADKEYEARRLLREA